MSPEAAREREVQPGSNPLPDRGDAALVAGFLLGPAAFALDLTASYALSPIAVATGSKALLHALTIVSLAIAAAGLALSARSLRRHTGRELARDEPARARDQREHFLALCGVLLGAFSILLIVSMAIPKFVHRLTD